MNKLESLRAFTKVVELQSFSEAGRQLRLSRSAISKAVAELEESLGVQLLNRTTRHASPNENGLLYYDRALGILADIEAADLAVTQMQAAPRGLLRINAPMSFGTLRLGPALADFMTAHPQMQVHLVLSDDQVDPVQGGFDVTMRIADLESSSLIARRIMPIGRSVYAAPEYLAAHGEPQHPRDLRQHTLLTYGFLLTGNQWKLTGPDGEHWVQPTWALCANNAEVLRDAAAAGRGVALLPDFIAEPALREGRLQAVMHAYQAPALALHALYPPTRYLALKVRVLIDFLVARFAPRGGDGTRTAVTPG